MVTALLPVAALGGLLLLAEMAGASWSVSFEKPVLVGKSSGGAINASCGGGRCDPD